MYSQPRKTVFAARHRTAEVHAHLEARGYANVPGTGVPKSTWRHSFLYCQNSLLLHRGKKRW